MWFSRQGTGSRAPESCRRSDQETGEVKCPLCGRRRDYFVLQTYSDLQTYSGLAYLSRVGDTGNLALGKKSSSPSSSPHTYHLCEGGHLWPADLSYGRVFLVLGTTACGKTTLVHNLQSHTPVSLSSSENSKISINLLPPLCSIPVKMELPHPPPTLREAPPYRKILEAYFAELDGEAATGFQRYLQESCQWDNERIAAFGRTPAPHHILYATGRSGGLRAASFFDYSGEWAEKWATRDSVQTAQEADETLPMLQADGVIWTVDLAFLPGIFNSLAGSSNIEDKRMLVESARPGALLQSGSQGAGSLVERAEDNQIDEALRKAREGLDDRCAETHKLGKALSEVDRRGPNVFRAVVLTKADLLEYLLRRHPRQGWAFLTAESRPDRTRMQDLHVHGRVFLEHLVTKASVTADDAVNDLVDYLKSLSPDERRASCGAIARAVLDYYADPDHFRELVLAYVSPGVEEVQHIVRLGHAELSSIQVKSMPALWSLRTPDGGPIFSMRDLVIGIIVCSVLGASGYDGPLHTMREDFPVHYFLTSAYEAEGVLQRMRSHGSPSNVSGISHLLYWIL